MSNTRSEILGRALAASPQPTSALRTQVPKVLRGAAALPTGLQIWSRPGLVTDARQRHGQRQSSALPGMKTETGRRQYMELDGRPADRRVHDLVLEQSMRFPRAAGLARVDRESVLPEFLTGRRVDFDGEGFGGE